MKAYEKAHAWRELFTMAKEQKQDEETIAAMVERVTGKLIVVPPADTEQELNRKIIYPAEERTLTQLKCFWTTRMMWIVPFRCYPRVSSLPKHNVSYVLVANC